MILINSSQLNPFFNLAVEEYLLEQAEINPPTLFLWQSRSAMVVGKNQNPWRECDLDQLAREGVALARRLSGGGTVWQDEGNLNFSFILPRQQYDRAQCFDLVVRALARLGIPAVFDRQHSLRIGDRKCSGQAFCLRRGGALHHGTLLVHSDLARLQRLCTAPTWSGQTHAVASIPARVVNLAEVRPGLRVEDVALALTETATDTWGAVNDRRRVEDLPAGELRALSDRYASRDWVLGLTPAFEVIRKLADGRSLLLRVEKGIIQPGPAGEKNIEWAGRRYEEFLVALRGTSNHGLHR